jgi:NADP-reducing hydrogenase subunit HndD
MRYVCPICGYVYDEEKEGVPFAELPDTWTCPLCGALKSVFAREQKNELPAEKSAPVTLDPEMTELTVAELSVVCSNLARGCEKQYNEEAQALYGRLSDYFAAVTPDVPDASLEHISALIRRNLESDYPIVNHTAVEAKDRGTQRICVWGEKVTRILETVVARYEKEGEAFLEHTNVWVCTVCGFLYIGDHAPQICPVCKVPDWKFEKIEGRRAG